MADFESYQADARLLQDIAQRRDPEALRILFQRYQKPAFSLAWRITMQREIAEEILQEVMMVVWRSAEGCRNTKNVRGWLLRIVALQSLRHLRDRRREGKRLGVKREMESELYKGPPDDHVELDETKQALKVAYEGLHEDERQILALNFGAGLSQVEISKALGLSRRSVSGRIQTCLNKLRQRLAEAGIPATMYASADDLGSSICFEVEMPPGLDLRVTRMADQVCNASAVGKGAVAGSSKLLLGLLPVGMATVLAVAYSWSGVGKGEDSEVSKVKTKTELKPPAVPIPPVHRKWVFDEGEGKGLEVVAGEWSWKPAQQGYPAGMYTNCLLYTSDAADEN